jgi:cobalt-zinc-cadmium efflux system outer membrane protein
MTFGRRGVRRVVQLFALIGALGAVTEARADDAQSPRPAQVVPPATEMPATLSLDDALAMFRQHGFDLLIAEAAVRSAEGDVTAAGAIPNLTGNVGYGRILNYDPSVCQDGTCSANQWTIGLSDNTAIEDTLSGKRQLRKDVMRAALQAAKLSRVDAQRTLEFQVKSAYIQVVLADQALAFAQEVQTSNVQTLDLNKRRYAAGAINEGDLARVDTAKLESDQAVDQAILAARQARVQLAFLLGVRGRVPDFGIDKDILKYRVPGVLQTSTPEALLRSAFEQRPDLRAQGYQAQRAENAIALAKRLRFPDLSLNAQYTQTGSGQSAIQPPTISFGISGTLPVFYQQQGEIRKAEADYDTQTLTQAKLTAQVVNDVESAYAQFGSSRKLVERMEASLLERAKTARDITKRQFEGGTATLLDFLVAQQTFIATNLEYLQDLTNYWTAVFALEQAVGTELRK